MTGTKSNQQPELSVIMPIYNGDKFLTEAIESVLCQTFTNFEFIIIEDGSTDRTFQTLKKIDDERVRIIRHPKNHGLVSSLNEGVSQAKGKFIARMDADDISLPNRFKIQLSYLKKYSEVGVIGCCYGIINAQKEILEIIPVPLTNLTIKLTLAFLSPFAHGSVMGRKEVFRQYSYQEKYRTVEDYALWLRLYQGTQFYNAPECLYLWRTSNQNTTSNYKQLMIRKSKALQKQYDLTFLEFRDKNLSWNVILNLGSLYKKYKTRIHGVTYDVNLDRLGFRLGLDLSWRLFRSKSIFKAIWLLLLALWMSPMAPIYYIKKILK